MRSRPAEPPADPFFACWILNSAEFTIIDSAEFTTVAGDGEASIAIAVNAGVLTIVAGGIPELNPDWRCPGGYVAAENLDCGRPDQPAGTYDITDGQVVLTIPVEGVGERELVFERLPPAVSARAIAKPEMAGV